VANEADARVADNAKVADIDKDDNARFVSFSLTKCFAIFAEVKEYFEANNNQLGLGFNL
jgi:hypothetical protein